jgi:SagB-type dehydrogenase family enzyme
MLDDVLTGGDGEVLWEFFHENSKISRAAPHPTYKVHPSDAAVARVMRSLQPVHAFVDFPKVDLPKTLPAGTRSLEEVIRDRETARDFAALAIRLDQLARILELSYGISMASEGTAFLRDLRVVPSGGALYPLELYLYAMRVSELVPGLYHYNPEEPNLDVLNTETQMVDVANCFVQPQLARAASAILFISAFFERSVFKYGERAYRFVLLEAGHLAQNAILTAADSGLAAAPIGGFFDREVDRLLGFDGVNQSVVYVILLGHLLGGRKGQQPQKPRHVPEEASPEGRLEKE